MVAANIFYREILSRRASILFWSLGMFLLVASGVAKFYGYSDNGHSNINQMLGMFPHSLQVLFGLNGFDLTRPTGAYGILFMYVVLTVAVHATLLGVGLITSEEQNKTAEFLFTKPVSRAHILWSKVSAGLVVLGIINLVTLASSLVIVDHYSKTASGNGELLLLDAALFFLQLLFFTFGATIAAINRDVKSAAGRATALLVGFFVLYFAINLNGNIEYLKYFTPFKYYEAQLLLRDHHLDLSSVGLTALLLAICLSITYIFYKKRELSL